MIIKKVRVEVDQSTFVPIVKFEGQFKMELDLEHPYGTSEDAAEALGKQILQEIVDLLKRKDTPNAYRYEP